MPLTIVTTPIKNKPGIDRYKYSPAYSEDHSGILRMVISTANYSGEENVDISLHDFHNSTFISGKIVTVIVNDGDYYLDTNIPYDADLLEADYFYNLTAGASRWVATESPVIFGLQRKDFSLIDHSEDDSGFLMFTLSLANWVSGMYSDDDSLSLHCSNNDSILIGLVTNVYINLGTYSVEVTTDITWVAGMTVDYVNNNTTKPGYYFEAQLTINGIVNPLTVKASPDLFGYADIDISGVLQTVVLPGKSGLESVDGITPEDNKSGRFEVAFRECWYGSSESYTDEGNYWNYAEFVRSRSQGSNLVELTPVFVSESPPGTFNYANPLCNLFEKPVFFRNLPFSMSYLQGMSELGSPPLFSEQVEFILIQYFADGNVLGTKTVYVNVDANNMGRLCSINIWPEWIDPATADFTFDLTSHQVA